MSNRGRITLFIAAAVTSSLFLIDFCNLVYACGCRSLWAGADAACNIHTHGVKHCPWCSIGLPGSVSVWAIIIASQSFICFRINRLAAVTRSLAAFAAFPVTGGLLALVVGLWTGYWT